MIEIFDVRTIQKYREEKYFKSLAELLKRWAVLTRGFRKAKNALEIPGPIGAIEICDLGTFIEDRKKKKQRFSFNK